MKLDEKALEAARKACSYVGPHNDDPLANAISAYLAALPAPTGEVAGLVETIDKHLNGHVGCTSDELHCRSADALTAQAARIAELEREKAAALSNGDK